MSRTQCLDTIRLGDTLRDSWEMEGYTGWSTGALYPDNIRSRMESWKDIVVELEKRLAWFEHEAYDKIELAKEPLKRELRRVLAELQELIRWNQIIERQRDDAKRQLPPVEGEVERLQVALHKEVSHHLETRDELRLLKESYHAEIQQWKDQLEGERKARQNCQRQQDAEIEDLKARRNRAEELLEDQKQSLIWKDEVIGKYKAQLTDAQQTADKFERKAESLQRQLDHSIEEREQEKAMAEIKLQSSLEHLKEQHATVIANLNEMKKRTQERHESELADKDAEREDLRYQLTVAMSELEKRLLAEMKEAVENEKAKTATVTAALEAAKRHLSEEKRAHEKTRQAYSEQVSMLEGRLAKIDKQWGFKLGEVQRELQTMTIKYEKSDQHGMSLRSKIADIEHDHWQYQSLDRTAGPHIQRGAPVRVLR